MSVARRSPEVAPDDGAIDLFIFYSDKDDDLRQQFPNHELTVPDGWAVHKPRGCEHRCTPVT
jgi:hypothetical protein